MDCDCNHSPAYRKVAQMDFDTQFWKQCYSVKHDWGNFSDVSFESILIILHEICMIIVIHPKTCSQHSIVSGFCFFWDALYNSNFPQRHHAGASRRKEEHYFGQTLRYYFEYKFSNFTYIALVTVFVYKVQEKKVS